MGNLFSVNSPCWRFVNTLLDLFWLNLLWVLCCLPLVTAGAATTALYTVILKYTQGQEGYLTREYFRAFRENILPSTLVWLLLTGIGLFLCADLIIYLRAGTMGLWKTVFLTVFFAGLLLYVFTSLYVYAYMAFFQNTVKNYLKNALILAIWHWPSSILMVVLGTAILTIGFLVFPPLLFIGFPLFCLINATTFHRIFAGLAESSAELSAKSSSS